MREDRMRVFGLLLGNLRKRRGVHQREMAKACELSLTYVSLVEKGARNLSNKSCIIVAKYLGIDAEWLLLESHRARWDSDTFYAFYPEEIGTQGMYPLAAVLYSKVRRVSNTVPLSERALIFRAINAMLDFAEG